MQRTKRPPIRNKINLTDPSQVRAWSRRLSLPASELRAIIEKVGNSVSGVTKEVDLRRAALQTPQVPPPASITEESAKSAIPTQA
jgi:predicted transcriptional regulator